tara:strand:+ start:515 stop:1102 length:588 start_codon:yes stop_codon:yes gene_type:complete
MKQNDILDVSGHLEIFKIFSDGTEEQVFDDHNVITSGMGVGLAMLFAGQGSSTVEDFQIRYFQVGSGAPTSYDYTQIGLGGYQKTVAEYGNNVVISNHKRMLAEGGSSPSNEIFLLIPDNVIKKSSSTSVTYVLYLPEDATFGQDLNEIGLFMSNPLAILIPGQSRRSPLVAYRTFNNIKKTNQFSLVFKWKLSF